MQQYFYDLADHAKTLLQGAEVYTAFLSGEDSDFCRLTGAKVRQAGNVKQNSLSFRLIDGRRHAEASITLAGAPEEDRRRLGALVQSLRDQVKEVPDDPHLLYATKVNSTERVQPNELPDPRDTVQRITEKTNGLDLVGVYAAGGVHRGFANSFGQRNWYQTFSFNFDWSFYLRADKAVKTGYAGFQWQDDGFGKKVEDAKAQLAVLAKEPRTIKPGRYRVFIAPGALCEVTDLMSWGGFSMKAHKTKQTPLLKMVEGNQHLNPGVTISEHTAGGISPDFSSSGFTKPPRVTMIENGRYKDSLISARSAMEYKVETNGAHEGESPMSLEIGAGSLAQHDVLKELKDGIYLNNLWYLNFSDRPACRVTGMTRFASFWVENGQIKQPLNVMRFDESVLRMLGDKLVGLTRERELILSSSSYGQRHTVSNHLPGALVDDFCFTL